jgi:hypothetical protein
MDIFKNKKRFLVDYTINGDHHGLLVMARSEDDAKKMFEKKVEHKIFGIYPSPAYEVTGVRRVHKKIQF